MERLKETQINPEAVSGIIEYCRNRGRAKCNGCRYSLKKINDGARAGSCIFANCPDCWNITSGK